MCTAVFAVCEDLGRRLPGMGTASVSMIHVNENQFMLGSGETEGEGLCLPETEPCAQMPGPLTWRGRESHHTIVGESTGFKLHAFFPSFHLHLPLWEEKE